MKQEKKLSAEELANIEWAKNNLSVGMKLKGKVKNVKPFGVFVTLKDGVDGLLLVKNMSVSRIKDPNELFKKGDIIDVLIKELDKETGNIILSHKEFLGTWEENVEKIKVGDIVTGTIRDTTRGGIFIELMPNLVGLAEHKSGLEYGEKVQVRIKRISPENHKIKLVILD